MPYLIDTNIAIHALEGEESVLAKMEEYADSIVLSVLSLVELQRGLYRRIDSLPVRRIRLSTLIEALPVLPFGARAAEAYGQTIAQRGWVRAGITIG